MGVLDAVTGIELRVYPLYLLPLSLGAWSSGRRGALALSVLATMAWACGNAMAGLDFSSPVLWAANSVAQLVGFATVGLLIAELRRRLGAAAALGRTDALTGLANRREFHAQLDRALRLSQRRPRPLALVYIDLDNFKTVNDTRGHEAGDTVLRIAAAALRDTLRGTDVTARLGGDEFAALLPESDERAARVALERFRARLNEAMLAGDWPVTASIGALVFNAAPPTLVDALHGADELMYRAKREGKNRLTLMTHATAGAPSPGAPPARG